MTRPLWGGEGGGVRARPLRKKNPQQLLIETLLHLKIVKSKSLSNNKNISILNGWMTNISLACLKEGRKKNSSTICPTTKWRGGGVKASLMNCQTFILVADFCSQKRTKITPCIYRSMYLFMFMLTSLALPVSAGILGKKR